jgi:hypothetical protein
MRIGCMDITEHPGTVTLVNAQAGHPEITFTRHDWEEFRRELRKLPAPPSPVPLEKVLGNRLV